MYCWQHGTGTGRNKWRNRGSRGKAERSGGREKCVGEKTAERSSSEDRDNDIEMEGEHGTEEEDTDRQLLDGKGLRPGTHMLATHNYTKNQSETS